MAWHWKELLPVDRFIVRASQYITETDRLTLTMLYQPLIGAVAHSLYVSLLSQLERDQYWSESRTHRQLMVSLDVSLKLIYEERKKLEGIGLLKTYQQIDESEATTYIYELQPPMSPKQFFENDVLSVFLFNRLGKSMYRKLRERFILDVVPKEGYKEVTKAFDEVFTSLHHSEMVMNLQSEMGHTLKLQHDKEYVSREGATPLTFVNADFDFDLFETSLSKTIVPEGTLTEENKQLIARLAFVYQMEPLEMSSLVSQVLVHSHTLDHDELRKRAQKWYKIERDSNPPTLALRTHPEKYKQMTGKEPTSEEERMIQFYETTSPLKLLEIRANDGIVANADVKIAESLVVDHKLLPGVANVLLDFMLFMYDMKLAKPLVDKIAGHWARKNIKTVHEAMQLALEERRAAVERKEKVQSFSSSRYKRPIRRDTLPKWLVEEQQKKEEQKSEQPSTNKRAKKNRSQTLASDKSFEQMLKELNKQ